MLKYIKLENFLSHKDTYIEFSEGVNVFIGKNGSGKSSVIDAITYALYGKHGRGTNTNIVMHNARKGSVILSMYSNGREYEVYREFNDKGSLTTVNLRENGKIVAVGGRARKSAEEEGVSKMLESILGLSYDDASIATIIRQGELDTIIDLKPKEVREMINRLTELDKLDKAYVIFKDVLERFRTRLKDEIGYDERDLERIEKDIGTLNNEVKELEIKKGELTTRKTKEEERKREVEDEIKKMEVLKSKYDEYIHLKDSLSKYITNKKDEYSRKYLEIKRIIEEGNKMLTIVREDDSDDRYNKLIEIEKSLEQRMNLERLKDILTKNINNNKKEIDEKESILIQYNSIEKVEFDLYQISKMISDVNKEITEIDEEMGKMRKALEDYETMIDKGICPTCGREVSELRLEEKRDHLMEDIRYLQKKKEEIKKREIEFRELERKRREYENAQREVEKLRRELEKKKEKYESDINEYKKIEEELLPINVYNEYDIVKIKKEKRLVEEKRKNVERAKGWLEANKIIDENSLNKLKQELEETNDILNRLNSNKIEELAIDHYLIELINRITSIKHDAESFNMEKYNSLRLQSKSINDNINSLIYELGKIEDRLENDKKKIGEMKLIRERLIESSRYIELFKNIREDIYHKLLPQELREWILDEISHKASEYLSVFDINISTILLKEEKNDITISCHGIADLDINSLSGGEKVAISLALRFAIAALRGANNTDFIILDEPTMHLDQERRRSLVKLITKLAGYENLLRQIVLITHDAEIFEDADIDNIVKFEKYGGVSRVSVEK